MTQLIIVTRDGNEVPIKAKEGYSLMEVIRDSGVDQLLALCGGCCSCATCHVYIDPAFAAQAPRMTADESDLLSSSEHRTENSRLSCQVPMSASMDGMRVTVAPED